MRWRVVIGLGVVCVALLPWPARSSRVGPCTAPHIVVTKHLAQLALVCEEGTRTFPVTFGASPVGPKRRRGDERTPEGHYTIVSAVGTTSRFHRFLKLSYPNADDRRRAARDGVDPGGGVGIHGVRAGLNGVARAFIRGASAISAKAWGPTDGCIGMTNEDVEVVFDAAPVGTPVEVDP